MPNQEEKRKIKKGEIKTEKGEEKTEK